MKKTFIASALAFSAVTALTQQPSAPIDYRFDQVKRTVTVNTGTQELNVSAGTHAQSGAKVTTGWFSYALIATEQYRAKFEIFASTQVRTAAPRVPSPRSSRSGTLRSLKRSGVPSPRLGSTPEPRPGLLGIRLLRSLPLHAYRPPPLAK